MFVDVVGCSEISNHKTLQQYSQFLADFHSIFLEVTNQHRDTFYEENERRYFKASVRGDEGLCMIFIPGRNPDIARDVDTCINVALDLKRRWLLSSENAARIKGSGLLPIDIAVGIHLGRVFINEGADGEFQPEGYAINLTKRIEGASREGKFTHIFVSEAAQGQLDLLTGEKTYTFAPARTIATKGISQTVHVFEVKHHFLATDWSDLREKYPRTRALDFNPTEAEVALAKQAHQENPTNLWLAEEYIMLKLQYEYKRLSKDGKDEDVGQLRASYADAGRVCRRLETGDQRDAGVLCIGGFIAGEYKDYRASARTSVTEKS